MKPATLAAEIPVPLTPEQEWTLVGCGLLALADRVLTGSEASRLLLLVSAYLDADEQDEWMDKLTDHQALTDHFEKMSPPPAEEHQALLERVWTIALADGEASMTEIRAFDQVGARLGLAADQLSVLRKKWTYQAMEAAELAVGFLALLLHRGGPPSEHDITRYDATLARLPLGKVRRERLHEQLTAPPSAAHLAEQIHRLSRIRQLEVLSVIADQLKDFPRRERARELFEEIAEPAGISSELLATIEIP
ncbi:MAG: TerB family tellurite resistance protein [Nannocystis sp.]|nr:TerB family tellurite resistance protein [Nannocystis sp.]